MEKQKKEAETTGVEMQFLIKASYLEIYNEVVRDLIKPSNEQLDIREDPIRGNVVSGLH